MFSSIFPQIGLLYTNIPRLNCATRLILQAAEAPRNHTYAAEMSNTVLPQPPKKLSRNALLQLISLRECGTVEAEGNKQAAILIEFVPYYVVTFLYNNLTMTMRRT